MSAVVPLPLPLSILTKPADCVAKPKTELRPSPLPFPLSLAVKYGVIAFLEHLAPYQCPLRILP